MVKIVCIVLEILRYLVFMSLWHLVKMCYCRCSLDDKCRRFNAELMRERHLTCDAKSAARVATQAVESLRAELTAVKQSRDQLDADLRQAHELLRERTQSLMQYFDQSVAVEASIWVIWLLQLIIMATHI